MDDRYFEATARSIQLEGQIIILWLKLQSTQGRVEAIEEKATTVEMVARAAKAEAAKAVKDYKKYVDFEDEVSEAACDTY